MLAVEIGEPQATQFRDPDAGIEQNPEDGPIAHGSTVAMGPASLGGVQARSSRSNSSGLMVRMSSLPTLGNTTRSNGLRSRISRHTSQWKKARTERA